tara:strand:- start:1602 stop:1970 length:369 start_codon:yes stop_codon:yes gene_type:complete
MAKIYESPDGGKTVYVRDTDTPDKERELLFDYKLMDAEIQAQSSYNDGWTQEMYREYAMDRRQQLQMPQVEEELWPAWIKMNLSEEGMERYGSWKAMQEDGWELTDDGFWINDGSKKVLNKE